MIGEIYFHLSDDLDWLCDLTRWLRTHFSFTLGVEYFPAHGPFNVNL